MNHDHLLAQARGTFMEESREMLAQFEATLLVLETNPDDAETLNAAFRAAHTIKGSSGLFGFKAVVQFTHEVEAVLDAMRQGALRLTGEAFGVLLKSCDQIARMLAELGEGAADATPADPALIATLVALHSGEAGAHDVQPAEAADASPDAPAHGSWGVTVRFGPDALRNGFDPVSFIHYLPRIGEVSGLCTFDDAVPALEALDPESCHLGFTLRLQTPGGRAAIEGAFEFAREDCVLELQAPAEDAPSEPAAAPDVAARAAAAPGAPPAAGAPAQAAGAARRGEDVRTIRVSADKLDRLIDLIGELVIAGSGARMVAEEEGSSKFSEAAQRIAHLVEEARDGALQLRMVQIGETFARFHRVVRDSAKSLGKDIELSISGGDTELDKSMVEMIADPLTHLVRNSVDHGVETAEVRVAAGKPARGRVALNAYHDSGSVVVEVTDDGKGLDRTRILSKAIERGLVKEGEHLSDEDVDQLIFAPGFSTASQVTDISGRGVGMDVVKRNIEALRGTVQLASTPGRGTTTQIRLPLTLAIIDGFLVVVGGAHYIVPLEMVVECIERPSQHALGADGCTGHFELRGQVLPFIDVRAFFGMDAAAVTGRQSLIVVRYGPSKVGLLVDRLMGEYQTVIKPLGKLFQHVRGIAGSTILGSGGVALILDVAALVAIVARVGSARPVIAASVRASANGG